MTTHTTPTPLHTLLEKHNSQGYLAPDDSKRYRVLLAELISSDPQLAVDLLVPFKLTMPDVLQLISRAGVDAEKRDRQLP
jgi:hypothetical protein